MKTFISWYMYWMYRTQLAIKVSDPIGGVKWAITLHVGAWVVTFLMVYMTELGKKSIDKTAFLVVVVGVYIFSELVQKVLCGSASDLAKKFQHLDSEAVKKYRYSVVYVPIVYGCSFYFAVWFLANYVFHVEF